MKKIIKYFEEYGTETVLLALVFPIIIGLWVALIAVIRELFF